MLQTQCRRLEAQHYSLSLTAEQLSHSMAVSATGEEGPGWGGAQVPKTQPASLNLSLRLSPLQTSFEGWEYCS